MSRPACERSVIEPMELANHIAETVDASDDVNGPGRMFEASPPRLDVDGSVAFFVTVVEPEGVETRYRVTIETA